MDKDQMRSVRLRFRIFLVVTLLLYGMMHWLSGGLSGSEIVAFEVAKTELAARNIMAGWDAALREQYLWSIYVDYLLLCAYSGLFYYACRYAAGKSGQAVMMGAASFFAWLGPVAGLMDVLENTGMMYTIHAGAKDTVVHFTYDMAVVKFSLLLIVALYIMVAMVFRLLHLFDRH